VPLVFVLFSGCSLDEENAQSIVDKSIKAHGGELFKNSIIEFDFRGRHYIFERGNGIFKYHRIFDDSLGTFHDILSNDDFRRLLNNQEQNVTEEWKRRYSNSVNSVAYFALLPFGLNDLSVNKSLIGEEEIKGNAYYKIMVTFNQEGGGEDFEDVFVFWINKNNYQMEYFGYFYKNDGGGIRFREAINSREKGGIILSDYQNFKGEDGFEDVGKMAELYKSDQLKFLSEITLENLEIRRFK
jgi:hypothetical protein